MEKEVLYKIKNNKAGRSSKIMAEMLESLCDVVIKTLTNLINTIVEGNDHEWLCEECDYVQKKG